MNPFTIHPDTILGPVVLQTADLFRAVEFYADVIGLHVVERDDNNAVMGVEESVSLVELVEQEDAMPKPARTIGLYHFALLLPTRLDLARALRHLTEVGYPLQGASDHLVSEALYLADPDGNGIEIYADRPRDAWQWQDGQLEIATLPLDIQGLTLELERDVAPWTGLPAGTRMGHIHLHVGDLESVEAFYRHALGFNRVARYGPSASFLSAGGYHHHIGMNTWIGVGAPSAPANATGMKQFSIYLPDGDAYRMLREHLHRAEITFEEEDTGILLQDPSKNRLSATVVPRTEPLAAAS